MLSWDLYFYVFVSLGNQTQGSCMIGNQSTIELHPSLKESLSLSLDPHFFSLLSSLHPLSIVYLICSFTAECKSIYLPLLFLSSV